MDSNRFPFNGLDKGCYLRIRFFVTKEINTGWVRYVVEYTISIVQGIMKYTEQQEKDPIQN